MTAATVTCPLPACTNATTHPAVPCTECQQLFGELLHESDRPVRDPQEVAAELAERDAAVQGILKSRALAGKLKDHGADRAALQVLREPIRAANQLCWMCEQRRTCTRVDGRWECESCREIR